MSFITETEKRSKILAFCNRKGWQFDEELVLEKFTVLTSKGDERKLVITYAPLEAVNQSASLVVVGITPGEDQAAKAFEAAQTALRNGASIEEALREAKRGGSFGGEMRQRLVAALNLFGLPTYLKLRCASMLFEPSCAVAHFTSLLKFPVFVEGRGYDGKGPIAFTGQPTLLKYHEEFFMKEIQILRGALYLPLGQTVRDRLATLAANGHLDRRQVLPWLLHPSKNNRNRYSYLLGNVSRDDASGDTNTENIDVMRNALTSRLYDLVKAGHWRGL